MKKSSPADITHYAPEELIFVSGEKGIFLLGRIKTSQNKFVARLSARFTPRFGRPTSLDEINKNIYIHELRERNVVREPRSLCVIIRRV